VRLGAENKKQVMVMVALLAIAVPLIVYEFKDQLFGSASASPPVSVPAPTPAPKASGVIAPRDSSDPRLRLDILEASRRVKYESGGRNIFRMEEKKIEPVKVAVRRDPIGPPQDPTPTPPPPPPPIPIIYYGYASKPGEPKRIFLQKQGESDVFVAAQGDIVARRYRIVQIQPNSVTMEDVITSNRQPIPLTVK
jgi:hypothetical protein